MTRRSITLIVLVLALCCLSVAASAQTPATGTLESRVLDGTTGDPLPGATVAVEGTPLLATTDRTGSVRLSGVPVGDQTLIISYLGSNEVRVPVKVTAGVTTVPDVKLTKTGYEETVTVAAEIIRDADARALNQQKTAPNITNVVSADQIGRFPDPNAAETTQRIPGISIQRDQGEGRYVIVRGTEPRLNSMMIDGERIPSPDPLLRQVALDVVPSDLLQAIEVSKALTPDQDADSIGGSVNLVMKQAPERLRLYGAVGGGFNEMLDSYSQSNYSVTAGKRFANNRMGAIVSLGGSETERGNQDMEVVYASGNVADFDPRFYDVNRGRIGVTGAFDFRQSANSNYGLRAVFNRYIDDHENRQRYRQRVANRRIERELRDRTHIERIASLTFSGRHLIPRAEIDYRLVGAYSDQYDPLTMTTVFRQSNVNFAPNVTPDSIDPDNIQVNPLNENIASSTFNQQVRATNFAKDRDLVGALNLRMPIHTNGNVASFIKYGFKYRDKQKGRNRNESTITTSSTLRLTDFLETDADPPPFLDGRYNLLPFISQSAVERIPDLVPVTIARNHARDAEEFDGSERTAAGYVMAEIYAGPKLFLLPGFRYEHTASDYTGREVLFSPSGAYLTTNPLRSKTDYGVPLPGFHVRYALMPDTNVRAAVTRTLARPNYYDVVPYRSQNDLDNTVALGNADLQPTLSWNFDLLGEHYFKSVGVVSGGVFYKRLEDYIYVFTYDQPINGITYHYTQPLNGDTATVRGVELAVQNQLAFLPSPFNGLGVYANYTFTDSNASFPNHTGDTTLPGQSRHVGNLAVSYEKWGFAGRVSVNFHGSYVDIVGASNNLDRFYDTHRQLDFSLSQRVTKRIRLYMDGINLNDALLRYYQGVESRPLQEEHYHWWTDFGVKFDW